MRSDYATLLAAILLAGTLTPPLAAQAGSDPVASQAIPVRSIDLTDDSMSDLLPLIDLIGDARVVALGEGSHGAGSDFRAKARLIRFLHERMGFDVLLWEAGIYDMRYLTAALDGTDPIAIAADQALYAHWAHAAEVRPLLGYIRTERAAGRRFELAGFDLQVSQPFHSAAHLAHDLGAFFRVGARNILADSLVRGLDVIERESAAVASFAADTGVEAPASERFAPTYRRLTRIAAALLAAIDANSDALRTVHSIREIGLYRQMLRSLIGLDRINEPLPGEPERPRWDFVRRWNEREIVNAANIAWYVQSRYPDRRIIVWAHNAHIVRGYLTPDFGTFSARPPEELPIRPSGGLIRAALGSDLFTIMFTAYDGAVRRVSDAVALTSDTVAVKPIPAGSIEERLHAAGLRYAILPLGAAGGTLSIWLDSVRLGRIDTEFLTPQSLHWKGVADALFFVDHVAPSTLVRE